MIKLATKDGVIHKLDCDRAITGVPLCWPEYTSMMQCDHCHRAWWLELRRTARRIWRRYR